jgi:hypothetical protein
MMSEEAELPDSEWPDMRKAAAHEAGHIVVGAIYDRITCDAFIRPCITSDPSRNYTWTGLAYAMNLSKPLSAPMSVAGMAAELLDNDPLITANKCIEWLELVEELSETDKCGLPADRQARFEAFEEALAVLRNHKLFFDWAVEQLINERVITKSMVQEYLKDRNLWPTKPKFT